MGELYPLLMLPKFDPRPWGAQDLSPIYPNHKFEEKIGEAWLTGDDCKIANGPLAGQTLAQVSEKYQRGFPGEGIDSRIDEDRPTAKAFILRELDACERRLRETRTQAEAISVEAVR